MSLKKRIGKFSFVKNFKWSVLISLILIMPGLIGAGSLIVQQSNTSFINLGIDFLGGIEIESDFGRYVSREESVEVEALATEIFGVAPSMLQRVGGIGDDAIENSIVLLRLSRVSTAEVEAFQNAMVEAYDIEPPLYSYIGAAVSADLRNIAIMATLLAALLILIYIGIRFEFRSGLAVIASQAHDLLVVLSAYVVFQIPVNMTFIAVMLTTLGYSLNASIILFDRVRETKSRERKIDTATVIDEATHLTLSRAVNMTITTMLPVTFLIFLGVPSVRDFALPLFFGIAAGAYSSILLSGPIWNLLMKVRKKDA
ncbi:MAG: protein translocase subunit SecF [Oscillospiraceae bacterium]|nr:protein translocase subunit SecF [Oscillospiraceae bacterium]